jgi:putative aminopeptidase FrvX
MHFDLEFLKIVLSIPSISSREELVREFIKDFAIEEGIEHTIDEKGNIYLTKGSEYMTSGEYYPCVVSHMDTVHRNHKDLINENSRLIIQQSEDGILTALHPDTKEQTGIGGDDKCGVYICLEMIKQTDVLKAAFFVEEEIGMHGSKKASEEFFENVGYAIQFDAPSSNWITEVCSGVRIMDKEFKEIITEDLADNGYTKFSNDPFTDVNQLVQKFKINCINLGCGYYKQHSPQEYVVIKEVEDSLRAGLSIIKKLGVKKYDFKGEPNGYRDNKNKYRYENDSTFGIDPYLLDLSEDIVKIVLTGKVMGASASEIRDKVALFLENETMY